MKKIFSVFSILLFITSCSQSDENPFIGKWKVIETTKKKANPTFYRDTLNIFELDFISDTDVNFIYKENIRNFSYTYTSKNIEFVKFVQEIDLDSLNGNLNLSYDYTIETINTNNIKLYDDILSNDTIFWDMIKIK